MQCFLLSLEVLETGRRVLSNASIPDSFGPRACSEQGAQDGLASSFVNQKRHERGTVYRKSGAGSELSSCNSVSFSASAVEQKKPRLFSCRELGAVSSDVLRPQLPAALRSRRGAAWGDTNGAPVGESCWRGHQAKPAPSRSVEQISRGCLRSTELVV